MPSFKLLEAASNELDTIQSVLIIGAGLTGLTAAIRLRQANFKVTILERSPAMQDIGAGIQIPPNCSRVLEGLGVLQKIENEAIAPRNLIIRSQKGDQLHNQIINSDDDHGSAYPHLVIHRADFIRVLYEEALELGAHIQLDARVDYVDFEAGSVKLLTGATFTADIILGADGEHSICRKLLQGPKNTSQSSGNLVYRVMVPASVVASDPDLHCLINPGGIQAWYGPGSHLICYQLDRDDSFNVVLTLPAPTGAPTIGPQPADINVLREYFHDWDPRLQKLLELTDQTQCWTLHEHNLSDKWVHPSGRFILLGDAAHPILPYMAQGAAIAMESAVILAELIARHPYAIELPRLLQVFTMSRMVRVSCIKEWSKMMENAFEVPEKTSPASDNLDQHDLKPSDGFPYPLADSNIQSLIWGFDSFGEADFIWRGYEGLEDKERMLRLLM